MVQTVTFPGLGLEFTLDRVAFWVGAKPIYWYGILIACGMLLGMWAAFSKARAFGLDPDRAMDVILGAVVAGFVGARVYYVAFSWADYRDNWVRAFYIWEGGIALYGGVIGAFLAGFWLCRRKQVPMLPLADMGVLGLILAQAIGRWGNFINVEAFGCNTSLPWGMASPSITRYLTDHAAQLAAQGMAVDPLMPVHPTFFYESAWCLAGFVLLWRLAGRRRFQGQMLLFYSMWYGAGRFVIEGLRTDSLMWGGVRVSQAVALVCVVGAALVWRRAAAALQGRGQVRFFTAVAPAAAPGAAPKESAGAGDGQLAAKNEENLDKKQDEC